jgi:hypothetical protein
MAGTLHTTFAWDSSTGNLADLANVQVREYVLYNNGSLNPYVLPTPFPPDSTPNPYTGGGVTITGSDGVLGDMNTIGQNGQAFVKPYSAATNTAPIQNFQFSTSCQNNGTWLTFSLTSYTIMRSVISNGDGTWKYTVGKTGADAMGTINPLP